MENLTYAYIAPAGEVISSFIEMGLLHRNPEGFLTTTERAHALIDMWRSTPLPEMRWVDPRLDDKGRV